MNLSNTQKRWLAWGLVAAAIAIAAILGVLYPVPAPPADIGTLGGYNVPIYIEQGGKKLVAASGGEIEMRSGSTLDSQSGATVGFGGAVTASSSVDVSGVIYARSNLAMYGKYVDVPVSIIPTNGMTLVPTGTMYLMTPAGGVTITLGTSGIAAGTSLTLYNTAAQNAIIADTNIRTSTGAALTMGQYDITVWKFSGTEWIEVAFLTNS